MEPFQYANRHRGAMVHSDTVCKSEPASVIWNNRTVSYFWNLRRWYFKNISLEITKPTVMLDSSQPEWLSDWTQSHPLSVSESNTLASQDPLAQTCRTIVTKVPESSPGNVISALCCAVLSCSVVNNFMWPHGLMYKLRFSTMPLFSHVFPWCNSKYA